MAFQLNLLFDAAVDALVAMQCAPAPAKLPSWDAATMASTALVTLFDWWWPAMFGSAAPAAARQEFASALETMLTPVAFGPTCFVHRDFFAGNLIWLPQRAGIRRVGVLDFQGAAIGHPAYDLASLLQDARRDIPAAVAEHAIALMFACCRDIATMDRGIRAGRWEPAEGVQLRGKTLGVVGMGGIGAAVLGHLAEVAGAAFLQQQRQEVHLEQDVAQLVEQLGVVASMGGVRQLVGLLDGVGNDRALVLLTIPRTLTSQAPGEGVQLRQ